MKNENQLMPKQNFYLTKREKSVSKKSKYHQISVNDIYIYIHTYMCIYFKKYVVSQSSSRHEVRRLIDRRLKPKSPHV